MKLILEAIKSLFRGVNGRIQQIASALGKRIDAVQSNTKTAQNTANNALTTAKTAQRTAELAGCPIYQATSANGSGYHITIDDALNRHGQLIVIVPNMNNTEEFITLYVNGKYFGHFARYAEQGIGNSWISFPKNFLVKDIPVLVNLDIPSKHAYIVGMDKPAIILGYNVCTSAASTTKKTAFVQNLSNEIGVTAYVKFTNGNTADAPTIQIINGESAKPIVDRSGVAISADAIKTGYLHQFVFDGSNWVLID